MPRYELSAEIRQTAIGTAEYLVDPGGTVSINDAIASDQWKQTSDLNFGFSKKTVWIRFSVRNSDRREGRWFLEHGYPLVQDVKVFSVSEGRVEERFEAGKLRPFKERPIQYRNFVFPLHISALAEHQIYMSLRTTGTLRAPLKIFNEEGLLESATRQTLGFGVFFGIIIALALYNLFLCISFRDITYLYYVLYSTSFATLQACLNGIAYEYVWPHWVHWNNVTIPFFVGISLLFLCAFTRSFLESRRNSKKLDRMLLFMEVFFFILMVLGISEYGRVVNQISSISVTLAPILMLPVALARWRSGFKPAVYYIGAFVVFFAGAASVSLKDLGLLPMNLLTLYGMYMGAALEALLFSLGLAYRMKALKEGKLESEVKILEANQKLMASEALLEKKVSLSRLAEQVAHDIRSPLAALNMVAGQAESLPEEDRLIVRSAVGSINDIVNNLDVDKFKLNDDLVNRPPGAESNTELLSSIINSIISEKRAQFRDRPEVSIVSRMAVESYGLFSDLDANRFRRVLSNLINNSVESIENAGTVEVSLKTSAEKAVVVVSDTGKGIPSGILPKIGTRGFSYGKVNGTGLGLHSSKEIVDSWGGRLLIDSSSGVGTAVSLELGLAKPPSWYVPIVLIPTNSKIVVLDDDQSVHHVWKRRFSELRTEEKGIEVVHFSSAQQLESWVQQNGGDKTLFLVDYELIRQGKTGLDVIGALEIAAKSILVTSRYEESVVLDRCEEQGVRIIPKTLASIVPLRIETAKNTGKTEYVLIDDSEAIHLVWGSAARRANFVLHGFQSADKFFEGIDQFCSFETIIYIDSDLGTPERGEQIARRIRALGFEKIYLTTGYNVAHFRGMWWLSGVVGKDPPWGTPIAPKEL